MPKPFYRNKHTHAILEVDMKPVKHYYNEEQALEVLIMVPYIYV